MCVCVCVWIYFINDSPLNVFVTDQATFLNSRVKPWIKSDKDDCSILTFFFFFLFVFASFFLSQQLTQYVTRAEHTQGKTKSHLPFVDVVLWCLRLSFTVTGFVLSPCRTPLTRAPIRCMLRSALWSNKRQHGICI